MGCASERTQRDQEASSYHAGFEEVLVIVAVRHCRQISAGRYHAYLGAAFQIIRMAQSGHK